MTSIVYLLILSLSCAGLTFSFSDIQNEKWQEFGSSLLSVDKLTLRHQEKVRLQVELSHSPQTKVEWVVDSAIIGANEFSFGTSSTKKENSTLYTIFLSSSVKFLELISFSNGNYLTRYNIDVNANNTKSYFNASVCKGAIDDINRTSAAAYFHCTPELDSQDSWYQKIAIFAKSENNHVRFKFLEFESHSYVNVTYERNSTAAGIVVFSNRLLEKFKTFLFLDSGLTLNFNDVVSSITYKYIQDISPEKTDDEFGFIEDIPNQEPLEGERVTILCNVIGRNSPPVRVERNGMTISDTDDVYISNTRSTLWSSSFVTYLHASKEIEGNYSCVADSESKEVFPLYDIQLKPRVIWDLMNGVNLIDERKPLVVEGSKGLTVTCSTTDNDDVTFDEIKQTTLSKWTERLEVWIQRSTLKSDPLSMQYINCTATDKNGRSSFEMYL